MVQFVERKEMWLINSPHYPLLSTHANATMTLQHISLSLSKPKIHGCKPFPPFMLQNPHSPSPRPSQTAASLPPPLSDLSPLRLQLQLQLPFLRSLTHM